MKKLSLYVFLVLMFENSVQAGIFDIFKGTPNWIKSLCAEEAGKANNDAAAELIYDACIEREKKWLEHLKKKSEK